MELASLPITGHAPSNTHSRTCLTCPQENPSTTAWRCPSCSMSRTTTASSCACGSAQLQLGQRALFVMRRRYLASNYNSWVEDTSGCVPCATSAANAGAELSMRISNALLSAFMLLLHTALCKIMFTAVHHVLLHLSSRSLTGFPPLPSPPSPFPSPFPSLFFPSQLGHGVACCREDVTKQAHQIYPAMS